MVKTLSLAGILCLLLFILRVNSIGGIDPNYREGGNTILSGWQQNLAARIDHLLPYPESALLSGILLGVQSSLPVNLKKELTATSTIHIVVVSGQNLTILAGFVMSLVTTFGRRKTLVITLLVIVLYSLLTGLGVPVIRAAVMVTLTYLAQLFGRQGAGSWVLFLTAAVMLLINPNWLLNISFQLSFLATLGVVVVSPVIISRLKLVPEILREDLAVSLSAQLLTLPVIAFNFGQMSLIGLVVNSLILWTISPVMIVGILALLASFVGLFLGQIIGLLPGILLTYFVDVVKIGATLPGAGIKVPQTSLIFWAGYYLTAGGIVIALSKSAKPKITNNK